MNSDFEVNDCGSIMILQPMTEAAQTWSETHLPSDKLMFNGGVVVEPRYIADLVEGIQGDGLKVRINQ